MIICYLILLINGKWAFGCTWKLASPPMLAWRQSDVLPSSRLLPACDFTWSSRAKFEGISSSKCCGTFHSSKSDHRETLPPHQPCLPLPSPLLPPPAEWMTSLFLSKSGKDHLKLANKVKRWWLIFSVSCSRTASRSMGQGTPGVPRHFKSDCEVKTIIMMTRRHNLYFSPGGQL